MSRAATTSRAPTWRAEDSDLSSTSASSRYALSEQDDRPILTYDWRGETSLTTQRDLAQRLDNENNPALRVTKKPIPRFQSVIEVKRHDLYLDDERAIYRDYPNYDSSLASITLPTNVLIQRAISPRGTYDKLYIVSPETSPEQSLANSIDPSTHKLSRASTGMRDATVGAERC